jgi:aldehyde:ferredoxin oxidoreductase
MRIYSHRFMMYGFNGKVLKVNLDTQKIDVELLDEKIYRKYLGGRNLGLYYLNKEMSNGVDPLSSENTLVFATGVTTGVPLTGFCRHSVVAKSPLTNGFGEAEAGGFWGAELKFAGYDAVVIKGRSPKPTYLWVHDGEAELKDASAIWGLQTLESQEAIREELKDKLVRIAQIGPAGERLVRYACILNDLKYANGRSGLGAVMGSKNLKAIAVRGHNRLEFKDPEKIKELGKWFSENWQKYPGALSRSRLGTADALLASNADGILPTRNFLKGTFDHAEDISGDRMKDTILMGTEGCYACSIRCKRVVKAKPPYETNPAYGGPEYETLAAFGSLCEVSDISAISYANQLCNAYGLDTISTGVTIAFTMECFENGILMRDQIGLEPRFGNTEAMVKLVDMIAKREGFGDTLAEGSMRASQKIGKGSEKYAMHVKGKELPMHEPRGKTGLALQYTLSPSGADHMQAAHDPVFQSNVENIKPFGILDPVDRLSLGPEKVRLFKYLQLWWNLLDCLCVCKFVIVPHGAGVFKINHLTDIVNAVTGWNSSLLELMLSSERSINLAREFNLREGITEADDKLPNRFFEPLESGPRKGAKISESELRQAIKTYYEMMGWDEAGKPERAKLLDLNI